MASLVADIEKEIQNKFLSEELNIETKLHHLNLDSQKKGQVVPDNPEEERDRQNEAASKRNKDILKETDLIVARYRSRSLYSPVDGHLEAWKLKYLKKLKEFKHKEQLRRFRSPPEPESFNFRIGGEAVAEQRSSTLKTFEPKPPAGILKNNSKPVAYLVSGLGGPIPLPRSTIDAASELMNKAENSTRSTPPSAGLFRTQEPSGDSRNDQRGLRQTQSTPGSARAKPRDSHQSLDLAVEVTRDLASKPV